MENYRCDEEKEYLVAFYADANCNACRISVDTSFGYPQSESNKTVGNSFGCYFNAVGRFLCNRHCRNGAYGYIRLKA